MSEVETEFLLISEAVARLEAGMFGGKITRPVPFEGIKHVARRYTVGSGVRRQKAASAIQKAIMAGSLGVHVFAPASGADRTGRPLRVPIDVLKGLPNINGSLPDHLVRHPFNLLRNHPMGSDLLTALSSSALHLSRPEFIAWRQREKSKGRWPSQRDGGQPRIGRPSKITSELLNFIRGYADRGTWDARDGIAPLVKLLIFKGAPNRNLVRRAVQQLFEETDDPRYRIVPRKRKKKQGPLSNLVQKSFSRSR